MLKDLVKQNRSYRRFYEERGVDTKLLVSLVDMARLSASARNMQSLRYATVNDSHMCEMIYPLLSWAGYLNDWSGPDIGERPSAYVVICNDTALSQLSAHDEGIASQTILLGAVEAGLGGCMIASIRKKEIADLFSLDAEIVPVMVIALGFPKEEVVIVPVQDGDIKYHRDSQKTHYVPKRSLDDVLIKYKNLSELPMEII